MSGHKVEELSELFTAGRTKEQIIASRNDALQAKSPGSVNQEQDSNTGSQDSPSLKNQTQQNLNRKSVTSNSPAADSEPFLKKGKNVKKQTEVNNVNKESKESRLQNDPSLGIVHESLLQRGKKRELCEADDEDVVSDYEDEQGNHDNADMPRKKHKNNELSHTPEKLVKMFGKFGRIDSVRQIRVPVKDPDQLKQVAAIKKEENEEQNTCICYMKFNKESSARQALVNNGKLILNLPIQVELADGTRTRDPKKTVFVAKLPYDVEDEPVRAHFADCGDIDNVHIVRHKKTGVGKGFGYIRFTDAASVQLALKLDGSSFQTKLLKVQTCDNKAPAPKSSNQISFHKYLYRCLIYLNPFPHATKLQQTALKT